MRTLVADEAGDAVLFHHGTARCFDAFDPGFVGTGKGDVDERETGFFFTPDRSFAERYACGPDGAVVDVHLSVANPYRVTGAMWGSAEGLSPEEAHAAGHDAYVVEPYDEGDMWIVFDMGCIRIVERHPETASTDEAVLVLRAA